MDEKERIARTVAEQRTGDEGRWMEFAAEVDAAYEAVANDPSMTVRDVLDWSDEGVTA